MRFAPLAVVLLLSACSAEAPAEKPVPPAAPGAGGTGAPTGGALSGAPAPAAAGAPPSANYPLDTCVVSGEKLGAMGDPVVIQHEGKEVRFCCSQCVGEFNKDPAKHLAVIEAARKK
jgi:hypothetical protein